LAAEAVIELGIAPVAEATAPCGRDVRRTLRGQVERLERELEEQRCSNWPRALPAVRAASAQGAPRLLSAGELEELRDDLVASLSAERRAHAERTAAEEESRRLREEILLDPAAHAGARVRNADVGEPGCGAVSAEPRGGLLGLLMGWWRVVVSSGCP